MAATSPLPAAPSSLLREAERLRASYGGHLAPRKLALLAALERARLGRARDVLRLHELLCFMEAYPDDAPVLARVGRMLASFARRPDLRRHARALADTGIAGTEIHFRFFAPTAIWLARRWPRQITIDWREFENQDRLESMLPMLIHAAETPGLDEYAFSTREWIQRLKRRAETDATFLIRRLAGLGLDPLAHEILYDGLDVPIRLAPGAGTPSRTRARVPVARPRFQRRPLSRERPKLPEDLQRPSLMVRPVTPREGQRLIDAARATMVTRSRDLDIFSYADRNDVRVVRCGAGLQFACFGAIPERRLLLEAVYGFLTLKNGVPIGYVLTSALYGSSEIAYNVFETFRGAEAATVYGRVLAMTRRLFGTDTFTIYPYQLGEGNDEALRTGAWWFYQKLGFRPRDPAVVRLMRGELERMNSNPAHRSSVATLEQLAAANVYFHLGRPRDDIIGMIPLASVGLAVTRYLADRFGSRRAEARRACVREAAVLLGVGSFGSFTRGERLAWERWSPLLLTLPGLARWSAAEKRALVQVVRAKGGRRESDFVRRFDAHTKLRRALRRLAERTPA